MTGVVAIDQSTGELVTAPPADPIMGMDPELARQAMNRHRELTAALLRPDDYQAVGRSQFVKRSGFQKIGFAYEISTAILSREVHRDIEGNVIRADATVRASRADGRFADGDGACAIGEERFRDRRGRMKIEHDLPATAVTRAKNRAIADLVGFGQVSAEEMEGEEDYGRPGPATDVPNWAQHAAGERIADVADDISTILGHAGIEGELAEHVTLIGEATFNACGGGIPNCVANFAALLRDAIVVTAARSAEASAPADDEPPATPEEETT